MYDLRIYDLSFTIYEFTMYDLLGDLEDLTICISGEKREMVSVRSRGKTSPN